MRFLKLTVENFRPYYGRVEIPLYDPQRIDKPLTLNIGYNEYGKTSISEAIMWCLYGESMRGKETDCVNDYALRVAVEARETVKMSVKLDVREKGTEYQIVRSKNFKAREQKRKDITELKPFDVTKGIPLHVLKKGEEIENPEVFINEHFLPYDLMKYFIFDADRISQRFIEDPASTIRDSIDRILGVKTLDKVIEVLDEVDDLYETEITEIQKQIPGKTSEKIQKKKKKRDAKRDALKKYKEKIDNLKEEKDKLEVNLRELEKGKKFCLLTERREELDTEIENLNEEFENLIPNMYLLFLEEEINNLKSQRNRKKPTRMEFEQSVGNIKTALGDKFEGIGFDSEEEYYLIGGGIRIPKTSRIRNDAELNLDVGGSIPRNRIVSIESRFSQRLKATKSEFLKFKNQLEEKTNERRRIREQIRQMGETERNKELKNKFKKYRNLEKQIEGRKTESERIKEELEELNLEIDQLNKDLKTEKSMEKNIGRNKRNKRISGKIKKVIDKTKEKYLHGLLTGLSDKSSETLRELVDDEKRFHTLKVNHDYSYNILDSSKTVIPSSSVNRSVKQFAVISFFLGIAEYLKEERGKVLPYIIDDPLIRLDPLHTRRLLEELSQRESQVIIHLIPGTEYNRRVWQDIKRDVNTQNWIARHGSKSRIEVMPPHKRIIWEER